MPKNTSEMQATANPLRPTNRHIFRLRIVILQSLAGSQRRSAFRTNPAHIAFEIVAARDAQAIPMPSPTPQRTTEEGDGGVRGEYQGEEPSGYNDRIKGKWVTGTAR